jgi:hypothetical protein
MEYLNDSVGSFLLIQQHKIENMTDIARVLQSVQPAYQRATKKEKKIIEKRE